MIVAASMMPSDAEHGGDGSSAGASVSRVTAQGSANARICCAVYGNWTNLARRFICNASSRRRATRAAQQPLERCFCMRMHPLA